MTTAPWRRLSVPQWVLAGLALALLLGVGVAASTGSASFGVYNSAWDGGSEIRAQASASGLDATVTRSLEPYTTTAPNETLAVVLSPTEAYTAAETARIREFVRAGGTLLVADDFGTHANALLAGLGLEAHSNGTLLRDERHHGATPALPLATNLTNASYTRRVPELALNYPAGLDPGNATVLARTSGYAYADTNGNGELDDSETLRARPVVAHRALGRGDVVVTSDASMFINTMLDDAGNRGFLANLLAPHDHVLLDYSHTTALPPAITAVLAVRDSAPLQLLAGVLGLLGALALARAAPGLPDRIWSDGDATTVDTRLDRATFAVVLRDQHPDWEERRVQRVLTEYFRQRPQPGEDE